MKTSIISLHLDRKKSKMNLKERLKNIQEVAKRSFIKALRCLEMIKCLRQDGDQNTP